MPGAGAGLAEPALAQTSASQTSFLSLGGGVTYWVDDRRGIRFDLRDAVTLNAPQTGYHYLRFGVGYTWLMGHQ